MNWLSIFHRQHLALTPSQAARLKAWQALPHDVTHPLEQSRLVVVDVESSGLNLAKDHLIAIGAVAIDNGKLALHDSFEGVLQQTVSSSKQNILIHGIGGTTQTCARPPAEVLLDFLDYLGTAPLIAFHADFDASMLGRALKQHLACQLAHDWLDLAYILPSLYPLIGQNKYALDDWLQHFCIDNYARHNALADATSTAQLFMYASRTAQKKNITDYRGLRQIETAMRWLKH